jgi:hypothetical protein
VSTSSVLSDFIVFVRLDPRVSERMKMEVVVHLLLTTCCRVKGECGKLEDKLKENEALHNEMEHLELKLSVQESEAEKLKDSIPAECLSNPTSSAELAETVQQVLSVRFIEAVEMERDCVPACLVIILERAECGVFERMSRASKSLPASALSRHAYTLRCGILQASFLSNAALLGPW